MSEATLQARLAAALAPLVQEGSVLVNDFHTPQVTSDARSPWLIIETADEVTMSVGESWNNPSIAYRLYVTPVVRRGGRSNKTLMDEFQALRQRVLATLAGVADVRGAGAATAITPFFPDENTQDPDSVAQRIEVNMTEYEV